MAPSLKDSIEPGPKVDVTEDLRALGFRHHVALSARLHEEHIQVWSPCACQGCEESARNATQDRVVRLGRSLRDAIRGAAEELPVVTFGLDLPAPGAKRARPLVALEAKLEERGSQPTVVVSLRDEATLLPPVTAALEAER